MTALTLPVNHESQPWPRVWRHDLHAPHSCTCPEPWEVTTDFPFESTSHPTFDAAVHEGARVGGLIRSEAS